MSGSHRFPFPEACEFSAFGAADAAIIGPARPRPDHPGADRVRKLIEFDDDTFDKLKQLARDRMATLQELADEAFADLLKKHGIPIDLKDALRKSAAAEPAPPGKAKKARRDRAKG